MSALKASTFNRHGIVETFEGESARLAFSALTVAPRALVFGTRVAIDWSGPRDGLALMNVDQISSFKDLFL